MGQRFTKRAVVPRLENLYQKHESNQIKESLQEMEMKKQMASQQNHTFTDPNALLGGFRRGQSEGSITESEINQKKFLEAQQGQLSGNKKNKEMPDDLIKFLNDLGPVQKKVDTNLTSKRIMKEISKRGGNNGDGDNNKTEKELDYFDEEAKKLRESRRYNLNNPMYNVNNPNESSSRQSFSADEEHRGNASKIVKKKKTEENTDDADGNKLTDDDIMKILSKEMTKEDDDVHNLIRQFIGLPEFMVDGGKYVLAVNKNQVSKFEKLGAKRL